MRHALIALPLVLAACAGGSAPVWLKPGTEARAAFAAEAACAAQARRVAPERRGIATAPRVTVGIGGSVCEGPVCLGVGTGRDVFGYDRNLSRRDQSFGACMGRQGYQLVSLPLCRGGETPLASHPFDARGVCVAPDGGLAAR